MGIFDKLAFWKKKEDFGDFDKDFGADLGLGGMGDQTMGPGMGRDLGMPEDTGFGSMGREYPQRSMQPPGQPVPMQQPFGAPIQPAQPSEYDYSRDKFEVVSAKLDSIRYTLESINQRLTNLERVAYGEQEKQKRW